MEHTKLNRIVASIVFLISIATYINTMPPTIPYWDVPEHAAASFAVQVQHPPGSPLLVLIMRIASMIPVSSDIAVRMILLNAIISAINVMLLYLIIVRLILLRRQLPESVLEQMFVYGSAVVGSLALTFCTTFWFNSIELETRNTSLLFTAVIIWLVLLWHEKAESEGSDRYLILIAYLSGLSSGVHIHGLLGLFIAIIVVYFRFYEKTLKQFFLSMDVLKFGIVGSLIFFVVYPGVVKWFPSMLNGDLFGQRSQAWSYIAIGLIAAVIYLVYYSVKNKKRIPYLAGISFLLVMLGFTTYTTVYIRANANTPMNENNPDTIGRLVVYLEREQYGETPLMKRMWSQESDKTVNFKKYTSDWDYLWKYQINHMYLRYLGWNFIGRDGDAQDTGIRFSQLWGIPLLVGLFGLFYQWKRDPKSALIVTAFFLLTGLALAFYFNMQEPQPRERDYFFVYSFFAFCIWIGMGVLEILDILRRKFEGKQIHAAGVSVLVIAFLLIPGNMLRTNYSLMSRRGHYLAWDYSYNLLQSVEKDGILITSGDNDTFPLWYLQDVEGIRRDVRVICLSLLNTDWYILQLKNSEPYGAKKVPISIPDERIDGITPQPFEPRTMEFPVPLNVRERWDKESPDAKGSPAVDTVKFYMPNTLQYGNVKALRVQDILVYDIIKTANWQRPVYFANTVGDDSKIGLQNYTEIRGFASKVVPRRTQNYWSAINEDLMRKQLFTDVKSPSKEPALGFRWRGLQDSTVHFDETQRRLIQYNSRQTFLGYAMYLLRAKQEPREATLVLDRMEQLMPRAALPIDSRIKFDIASIYSLAGDSTQFRLYTRELIHELEPIVEKREKEQINYYSNYIMLFSSYVALDMFDKASHVVDVLKEVYAGEQGVDGFIAQLNGQINTARNVMAGRTAIPEQPAATRKGK